MTPIGAAGSRQSTSESQEWSEYDYQGMKETIADYI